MGRDAGRLHQRPDPGEGAGYLLTTNYRDGATVKAGQPLYRLDPREYQADLDKALGDLAQAKAKVVKDQQNVTRYESLISPIDGVAGITQARVGDLIAPSTLMTTVSQLDPTKGVLPDHRTGVSEVRRRPPALRRLTLGGPRGSLGARSS